MYVWGRIRFSYDIDSIEVRCRSRKKLSKFKQINTSEELYMTMYSNGTSRAVDRGQQMSTEEC